MFTDAPDINAKKEFIQTYSAANCYYAVPLNLLYELLLK